MLPVVVIITEIIAIPFAKGTFVLSTVPADRREGAHFGMLLMLCALPLLAAAITYWTIGHSRTASILLAIATLGTAMGHLFTWLPTLPLVLIAILVPTFQRVTPLPKLPVVKPVELAEPQT